MRILIFKDYQTLSTWVAYNVAEKILEVKPTPDNPFVLGLPTGSSPIGTYQELVRLCKEKKVSFRNVVTFNMDEYVGIPEDHPESYHHFMWTVSMLQLHQRAIIVCDEEATMELKVGTVKYFKDIESHTLKNLPEL